MTARPDPPDLFTLLSSHARGALVTDIDDELRAAVEAARLTGKTATVTLKLTINPGDPHFTVTSDVTSKVPSLRVRAGVYFADREHRLTRTDPDQLALDLPVIN